MKYSTDKIIDSGNFKAIFIHLVRSNITITECQAVRLLDLIEGYNITFIDIDQDPFHLTVNKETKPFLKQLLTKGLYKVNRELGYVYGMDVRNIYDIILTPPSNHQEKPVIKPTPEPKTVSKPKIMNPGTLKQLSTRYLQTAKQLGYIWMDLVKNPPGKRLLMMS